MSPITLLSTVANAKIEKTNALVGGNHLYAEMSMMPNNVICAGSKAAQCMTPSISLFFRKSSIEFWSRRLISFDPIFM